MPGTLVLLTGPPGSGKTALCARLVAAARQRGHDVAGVLSPVRFDAGGRTGIDVLDLRSGETRPLAWRHDPARPATLTVGPWSFDAAVLARGDAALARATPCWLLVVDELGPLELAQGRGWTAGLAALDSGDYRLALAVVRPALLAVARARWPRAAPADARDPGAAGRLIGLLAAASAPGPGGR